MNIVSVIIPIFFCGILIYGMVKGIDVFNAFCEGVRDGLETVRTVLPSLLLVLTATSMLRASGGMDAVVFCFEPIAKLTGFPSEAVPVALMKPFSGSGASAMLESVLKKYGADSFVGRLSAVICSSTETTFYTVGVYLAGLKGNFGKIIFCALCTDSFSFVVAYFVTSLI